MSRYLTPRKSGPAKVNPDPPPNKKFKYPFPDPAEGTDKKKQLGESVLVAQTPSPPRESDRNRR